MLQEKHKPQMPDIQVNESEPVSWWTWRPGIKPGRAFVFGGLLALLALFLLVNGLTTLIGGILDSSSEPVRVPGVVTAHGLATLGSPELTIRLDRTGPPSSITLIISPSASLALTNGTTVLIDYGPHLHIPYALEHAGRRYTLPGTSASGNLFETLSLLVLGLLLLPYPLLLSFWGWRDLHTAHTRQFTASVVALRAARQTTTRTPGLVPRTTGIWHGVALKIPAAQDGSRSEILTFSIRQELYHQLRLGDTVQATCSTHLRHLYKLKRLENG